jgi:tripartite-type tricarboxylate transporter receptor subunit TctC
MGEHAMRYARALRLGSAVVLLVAALGTQVSAQSAGPIRLAVGAPAGGSIDTYSRIT